MGTQAAGIQAGDTLRQAGHRMRELGVAVLSVYGADGSRQGTISRDMIVRRIAAGGDPRAVTVGDLAAAPLPPRPRAGGTVRAALTSPPPRDPAGQAAGCPSQADPASP